jgi:hypothetical protein
MLREGEPCFFAIPGCTWRRVGCNRGPPVSTRRLSAFVRRRLAAFGDSWLQPETPGCNLPHPDACCYRLAFLERTFDDIWKCTLSGPGTIV